MVLYDSCPNFVFKILAERFDCFVGPVKMWVLSGVEVEEVKDVFATGVYHRKVKSESESCLEVNASSCTFFTMSHISYKEPRSADFSDNSIIYFAEKKFAVGTEWSKSGGLYSWTDTLVVNLIHFRVKPHCDKRLGRINGRYQFGNLIETCDCYDTLHQTGIFENPIVGSCVV